MVANKSHGKNGQPVAHTPPEPSLPLKEVNRNRALIKHTVIAISLTVLAILAAFFIAFLYGWYGLYALGIGTLVALPFVLIGGSVYCVLKRKWILLGFGLILLPPSWIITLLGCMSDPPWNPADISAHMFHASFLVSGALACWLFLTLIFWPGRS